MDYGQEDLVEMIYNYMLLVSRHPENYSSVRAETGVAG